MRMTTFQILHGSKSNQQFERLMARDEQVGGEWRLAVGGGSANRYVVYMTFDNMSFLNLLSRDKADQKVTLLVGGQDSLFPDNAVVDITLALRAAKAFAETGQAEPSCKWLPA